ncbi:transcriptional regulator [Photobacterium aquae]|uniref:Transcriptional regulator n=1 Tax=Photobacterium aquae TaxID=1195763 RepID=A0A0J1H141_9GAMM|nr:LysR family transcriptional regulator [Photobacterium aquae]KLV05560.1 transcriptional regulator [Photobacterium aquae]
MTQFDYNLLRVLEVLLEEQSVTGAAAKLHLSQSAVSKQLRRLREAFNDPLFERTAFGLRPTPRARQLAPELRGVIRQLEEFTRPKVFDPSQSQRIFKIHMVETAYSLTFPYFMPDLLVQAPKVSVITHTWSQTSEEQLLRCDIDMAISCREWDPRSALHLDNLPESLNYAELVKDYPVCLVRHGHPLLKEDWNLDTFLKYRHLQVLFGGIDKWLLDDVLQLDHQRHRDMAVSMTDFQSAMGLCERSDLILCAPARYVGVMNKDFKLHMLDVPVTFIPGCYALVWNRHFDNDPSHRWLRELIITSAQQGGKRT